MYNISYTKLEITKSHAMASGIKDVITVSAEERLIRRSDLSDEFSKIFWISSSRDLYAGATYRAENTVFLVPTVHIINSVCRYCWFLVFYCYISRHISDYIVTFRYISMIILLNFQIHQWLYCYISRHVNDGIVTFPSISMIVLLNFQTYQ